MKSTLPPQSRAAILRAEAIAERILRMKRERARQLWATAFDCGLPDFNCIHNAAIDDGLKGWCRNRLQLRTARICNELVSDYSQDRIVEKLVRRLWEYSE